MPEAVLVAAARSPIGRAYKGSLRDVRPDDLTARIVPQAGRTLREMGAEFAVQFPKIAARLGIEGIEVNDPYVERLLEGVVDAQPAAAGPPQGGRASPLGGGELHAAKRSEKPGGRHF